MLLNKSGRIVNGRLHQAPEQWRNTAAAYGDIFDLGRVTVREALSLLDHQKLEFPSIKKTMTFRMVYCRPKRERN